MSVINVHWIRPCPLYTPPVAPTDWMSWWVDWNNIYLLAEMVVFCENLQTRLSRGRRSRNKVSVGEPAEGSFSVIYLCMSGWRYWYFWSCSILHLFHLAKNEINQKYERHLALPTLNLLVTATMKNAAKCENVLWIATSGESFIFLT